jgi:hypothetical protein
MLAAGRPTSDHSRRARISRRTIETSNSGGFDGSAKAHRRKNAKNHAQ